jgi:predicted acetyltransferase
MVLQAGLAWQMGLLDVPEALATRGYPGTLSCRLELEVVARPIGANPLLLVLEVEQGKPTVSRGGSGALRIHQLALTEWYGGSLAVSRAALLGLVHGTPEDVETLGMLGGDRAPWLPEHN